MGHAIIKHQIGKIAEAEQLGPLTAQFEDLHEQRPVVAVRLRGAHGVSFIEALPDAGILQVRHDGEIVRGLQGEAPSGLALAPGTLAGRFQGCGRQARQIRRVRDQQLEGVGRIEHVFGEFGGELRQLDIELLQAPLPGRVEFGAMAAEGVECLLQEAPPFALERLRLGGAGEGLDGCPKPPMQGNAAVKGADFRLHGIEGGAELGVSSHGFQVPHHCHGAVQRFAEGIEGAQGVCKGAASGSGRGFAAQDLQALPGGAQQLAHRGLDMLGADAVEGHAKAHGEQRVAVVGLGHRISVSG